MAFVDSTLFCILLLLVVAPSKQVGPPAPVGRASKPEDTYYWAGVVEFRSDRINDESDEASTARRLTQYLEIINSAEADVTDVIAFPEGTLNQRATASFVPDPNDKIAPCNNLQYERVIRDVSCAARNRKKYVLINLTEKARCPLPYDTRPCSPDGLYHFNSNVAFDREGVVVSRYRKFNLFGEPGINTTNHPESVSFETDFGVRFGHFICFDLMFSQPALDLVRLGVTDFIFPTMWFSELPFLTASQIQQGWAYANNANLLASGASFPAVGSTGTGIYAGTRGAITTVMNFEPQTKLYVAQVPKVQFPNATITKVPQTKGSPSEMAKLLLKRDHINSYYSKNLPMTSSDRLEERICHGAHCCNFTINYTVQSIPQNTNYYRYVLAVYNSGRTFDGFADGQITTCAIFACSKANYSECATRFDENEPYDELVTFNSIKIEAKFANDQETFVVPNNVDTSIYPLDVSETEYSVVPSAGDETPHNIVTYELISPRSNLFTFAIWARKFETYTMSSANHNQSGTVSALVLTIVAIALLKDVWKF